MYSGITNWWGLNVFTQPVRNVRALSFVFRTKRFRKHSPGALFSLLLSTSEPWMTAASGNSILERCGLAFAFAQP